MTTAKGSVREHRMQRFCKGQFIFLQDDLGQKFHPPLGILSEKNIELFRGGVRANVWRWERERDTKSEFRSLNWYVGGCRGGRLHM